MATLNLILDKTTRSDQTKRNSISRMVGIKFILGIIILHTYKKRDTLAL